MRVIPQTNIHTIARPTLISISASVELKTIHIIAPRQLQSPNSNRISEQVRRQLSQISYKISHRYASSCHVLLRYLMPKVITEHTRVLHPTTIQKIRPLISIKPTRRLRRLTRQRLTRIKCANPPAFPSTRTHTVSIDANNKTARNQQAATKTLAKQITTIKANAK